MSISLSMQLKSYKVFHWIQSREPYFRLKKKNHYVVSYYKHCHQSSYVNFNGFWHCFSGKAVNLGVQEQTNIYFLENNGILFQLTGTYPKVFSGSN